MWLQVVNSVYSSWESWYRYKTKRGMLSISSLSRYQICEALSFSLCSQSVPDCIRGLRQSILLKKVKSKPYLKDKYAYVLSLFTDSLLLIFYLRKSLYSLLIASSASRNVWMFLAAEGQDPTTSWKHTGSNRQPAAPDPTSTLQSTGQGLPLLSPLNSRSSKWWQHPLCAQGLLPIA